ncbi:hypothetical protein ACTIGL_15015 [Bacillus shihchuchen]|uniref:Uncharacterized protein n=1 Tax=Bacillus shihchuchen TaxID=3036942 RepID=A0ABT7KVK4_9BACI|nr:hypothetical protein [Bacillus shihchuchen]
MIGIVALFILSWIALQIFGKQSLSVLGLLPTKNEQNNLFSHSYLQVCYARWYKV